MAATDLVHVRPASDADCEQLVGIYNFYIETSTVTFEEVGLTADELGLRLKRSQGQGLPWLVAEQDQDILGYAYAAPWRERSAYRHSVEVSAYVRPDRVGNGIGMALYGELLAQLEALPLRTAVAVIPLPNPASVALYQKLGFVQVAHLKAIGFKLGRWIDVGYWQRNLVYNRKL